MPLLNFIVHRGGQQPPVDIDEITRQLDAAVRAQVEAGNITPAEVKKFVDLVTNTTRLKAVKNFL